MTAQTAAKQAPPSLKLVVVGASKGTGKAVVEEALARGHRVVALARNPAALTLEHPKLSKVAADVGDPGSLEGIFEGADAVVIALGTTLSGMRKDPTLFSRGTTYVLAELRKAKVRRVVVLSANGTGDSRSQFPWLLRLVILDGVLRGPMLDHDRQEQIVRASTLDWTIVRPNRLVDGPAKRAYKTSVDGTRVPTTSTRADVADFLVNTLEDPQWVGKTVSLGG